MNHLSTETRPALRVEPAMSNYVEAPIAEAFDWKQIISHAKEQRDLIENTPLYLVVFRSQLKDGVDTSSLLEHDANAHSAALESPALIHYYADIPDEQGRAVSFCLWTKRISRDSLHAAAAKMITLYASYSIEKYDVRHDDWDVTLLPLMHAFSTN